VTFDFAYPNARPSERGWGSGYPNCQEEAWAPLIASNGVGFGRVHKNVQELFTLILNECIRRGYPPKGGQCWGSVCRCSHKSKPDPDGNICAKDSQGNPIPSNHSWGLAIDFNSIDNRYGADRQDSKLGGDPSLGWVPVLFRTYGFRWLGPPIDDWQHFDFAGSPSDATVMTTKARNELGGDEDMSDLTDGLRANRKGDPLKPNASPDWELGWRVAESIRKAAETPAPVPGPAGPAGPPGPSGTSTLPDDVLRSGDPVVVVKEP
jgi:hypothetical protein